jgi:branched-chain amino acid transport system substrate-binding protein
MPNSKTILSLLFIFCSTFYATSKTVAEDKIKIGAILPLSGDAAFWGENSKKAIVLAIKDMKKADPSLELEIEFEDEACSPKQAVSSFNRLVNLSKVKVILGPACSASTAAVAPLADKAKVSLLAFSESSEIKTGPYLLRLWVSIDKQGRRLAKYAFNSQKLRAISILSIQNVYGSSMSAAFAEEFKSLGGKIINHQEYLPDQKSFRPELFRIKASNPDAMLFVSYIADGLVIVKEAQQIGLKLPLFGSSSCHSPDFLKAVDGMAQDLVFADLQDSATEEFRSRWKSEFNLEYPGIQSGAPIFYDATAILARWIHQNKLSPIDPISYFKSVDLLEGVSGRVRFDSNNELDRRHSIFKVINDQPVLIED